VKIRTESVIASSPQSRCHGVLIDNYCLFDIYLYVANWVAMFIV